MKSPSSPASGLSGQVVAVTGAGSGLGRQYALDLATAGARVIVAGRSTNVHEVVDDIMCVGGQACACIAPVDDGAAIVNCALQAFGSLNGLVVNAGSVRDRSFPKMTEDDWNEVMAVHLDAAFAVVAAAWPVLSDGGGGSIILTTSGAALHGHFGQANYTAAKGGVIGFMRTLAVEGSKQNIRVNAIAPIAATSMTDVMFDAQTAAALPASAVSPFVLALLHPNCPETGAIVEAGGGWGAALRWERSAGLHVSPGPAAVDEILANWTALTDFTGRTDHPASILDSLKPALQAGRD